MSNTELAHKNTQGSPRTATRIWGVGWGASQKLKLTTATVGAAILPLEHNTTQTHMIQKLKAV